MSSASRTVVSSRLWVALTLISATISAAAQDNAEFRKVADIPYAVVDGHELEFDLYLPTNVSRPPLLLWVHGGAWQAGSKDGAPSAPFVDAGYALASVNYRLSTVAQFPAPVHDIKAAIRLYLRL